MWVFVLFYFFFGFVCLIAICILKAFSFLLGPRTVLFSTETGAARLALDGYMFYKDNKYKGTSFWKCSAFWRTKCMARATVKNGSARLTRKHDLYRAHNH